MDVKSVALLALEPSRICTGWTLKPDYDLTSPVTTVDSDLAPKKKPRFPGLFYGADEGTRTLDLLHGKQML